MWKRSTINLFLLTFLLHQAQVVFSQDTTDTKEISIITTVKNDYKSFYSGKRLLRLGVGFGTGAGIANSNIDHLFKEWYQDDIRSEGSDDFSDVFRQFGERKYLFPISILAAGIKFLEPDSAVGNWGSYTIRALATGGPVLLLMQHATGGSRPDETSHKSHWRPFEDINGVSGHSFFGAIPFLVISKMNHENPWWKYTALAASTATAWSRLNDNKHYFSQAALGWYMAWEAVDAVFDSDDRSNSISWTPVIADDIYGLTVYYQW